MRDKSILFEKILKIFEKARLKGELRLKDGTWLASPAPEIAPQAWHHVMFFPPLTNGEREDIEKPLNTQLPSELKTFFSHCNGLSLFGREISIWGKRKTWERSVEKAWQPFDLVRNNRPGERPKGSPYSVVYFGSTDKGDNWLFFDSVDGSIGRTPRGLFAREGSWPDFDTWFLDELSRLERDK